MSRLSPGAYTAILIVAAVLLTGCSDTAEPGKAGNLASVSQTTPQFAQQTPDASPAVTPLQTLIPINETAIPVRIFNGEYRWAEYRENSSVTMPPNPRSSWIYYHRLERLNGSYKGSPASLERVVTISDYPECCIDNVVTITKNGSIFIADGYSDPSTGRVLGAILSETIKGAAKPPEEYPPDDAGDNVSRANGPRIGGWMGFSPFGEPDVSLTGAGTEPVTVPAGTYPDARKYHATFSDGTPITFWVAPGVPVPVRYDFPDKYLDGIDPFRSYELAGWG